jgi:hypothetical protein
MPEEDDDDGGCGCGTAIVNAQAPFGYRHPSIAA